MAIHSNVLGSVTLTGDEAKAFTRWMKYGCANKAASQAAQNGRKMVARFAKTRVATLKPRTTSRSPKK